MAMTSVQSRINRSPVIEFVGLESQYQIWSYLVEIDRVTQWFPVRLTSPYLCSASLPWQNMQQLLVDWYRDLFLSLFACQDIQETPFLFYEEFAVAYEYTQNTKFVRHI
jgi:hypothetical protein